MLEALRVRAEQTQQRKPLTSGELKERIANSEFFKRIKANKDKSNLGKEV